MLYDACRNNVREEIHFDLIPTNEFILSSNDIPITKSLVTFVFNALKLREEALISQ